MSQPAGHQRAGHQPADRAGRDEAQPGPVSTDPGFSVRHIGPDEADLAVMLAAVGVRDIDQLIDQTVPAAIRNPEPLDLPAALGETAALAELERLASRNRVVTSLIGTGYSGTHTPAVIQRNVLENPAWYTAYTPYQPEISQGRLEALLNFQTMVCDLTGMDISNSSLLDEATAAAEGMTLARRQSRNPGSAFFVDIDCHPQVIAVLRTRAEPLDIELRIGSVADLDTDGLFGALLAYPGSSGEIRDLAAPISALHDSGALAVVATDLLALCLLTPPGEFGADVVVGSAQRFGVPMGFGGPHAAFMATRDASRRSLPGRLVGVSVDAAGRPALRLALQTREQHIRREKATSNICTAQVLLAVMASMYAVYHGPEGLAAIARRVHGWTTRVALTLSEAGVEVVTRVWFDTLWVRPQGGAALALAEAERRGINLRPVDAHTVGLSFDETTDGSVVRRVLEALGVDPEAAATASAAPEVHGPGPGPGPDPESGNGPAHGDGPQGSEARTGRWPDHLRRTTPFCTHPVFSAHRTETEMLRYLRRLSDQDLALDRTMIPLGSCTMKLNATTEMIPVTWPEFGALHPFAPQSQTGGYQELVDELCEALVEITGYDAVSVQPNAGSQGEFAGLLAIRAFHRSRGEGHRVVCLIPESAHGTNAASAVMAGMSVVVVSCDQSGNVDVADLRAKAASHGPNLAALMVTYPSTHGVFEESIVEICDIVHEHGGQVYLDGANLNALVGLARPGRFGADVSHLNLHKTFCIPHGGGGPGVGPVAVRAHLAPFLPGVASAHPLTAETPGAGTPEASTPDAAVGPVSAAPLGSASILPISWTYLRLMGPDGLQRATETAILSANYIATRLSPHFPVLYSGANGRVAHECILDIRPLQRSTGITNEDIAKRLIDYGFHAPTMSFPVAGTLMVEPTESESLAELDRFCEAMIAIRAEIDLVADGTWPPEDNPLVNAPHTAQDCCSDDWTHPYQRGVAAFPPGVLPATRYWPPVSRIDGGYGDRNLVCSCPPLHELASHS